MMTNKISVGFIKVLIGLILGVATAVFVPAQTGQTQKLTGVIRVPKAFGVLPINGNPLLAEGLPCSQMYVAALDPGNRNRLITVADAEGPRAGGFRDVGEFHTCNYTIWVPANKPIYVIAGMGNPSRLPEQTREPYYITDAWLGGTNNKPRRGYERGFAGKFIKLSGSSKSAYLRFDMYYAQVDPN